MSTTLTSSSHIGFGHLPTIGWTLRAFLNTIQMRDTSMCWDLLSIANKKQQQNYINIIVVYTLNVQSDGLGPYTLHATSSKCGLIKKTQ